MPRPLRARTSCLALFALALAGCEACHPAGRAATASSAPARAAEAAPASSAAAIAPRPRLDRDTVVTPPAIASSAPRPLVVFLHGLGGSGADFERVLGVPALAQRDGFSFMAPEGPVDQHGRRFWNAGSACCDFDGQAPDHVGTLGSYPTRLEATGAGRFDRFVIVGFSNGAFMAHRLACDVARVTGIVAIAGAIPGPNDRPCKPDHPMRVVVLHGDADSIVPYAGGPLLGDVTRAVPSAADTAKAWAERDGCTGPLGKPERRDLVGGLPGAETRVERYEGCKAPVELWTVEGADHLTVVSPPLIAAAVERVLAK